VISANELSAASPMILSVQDDEALAAVFLSLGKEPCLEE
jgi:hypothetical protein